MSIRYCRKTLSPRLWLVNQVSNNWIFCSDFCLSESVLTQKSMKQVRSVEVPRWGPRSEWLVIVWVINGMHCHAWSFLYMTEHILLYHVSYLFIHPFTSPNMMISYAKIRPLAYIVNIYFLSLSLAVDLSNYTVPLSNGKWLVPKCCISITESSLVSGMETLRSPSSNLTLKLITYALGIQISTCSINSTLPPVPSGTNATLIDATPYLNNNNLFNKNSSVAALKPINLNARAIGSRDRQTVLWCILDFNVSLQWLQNFSGEGVWYYEGSNWCSTVGCSYHNSCECDTERGLLCSNSRWVSTTTVWWEVVWYDISISLCSTILVLWIKSVEQKKSTELYTFLIDNTLIQH